MSVKFWFEKFQATAKNRRGLLFFATPCK